MTTISAISEASGIRWELTSGIYHLRMAGGRGN